MLIRTPIFLLALFALLACGSTQPDRSIASPVETSIARWSGTLSCSRSVRYTVGLALWETANDKFMGHFTLSTTSAGKAGFEHPVTGYRSEYGSIRLDPDRKRLSPDFYQQGHRPIGIVGRLDPESKKIIASLSTGCRGNLVMTPQASAALDKLAAQYGQYDPETARERQAEADQAAAMAECAQSAGNASQPLARYQDQGNPLRAPAFKQGLFVYRHTCLSAKLKKANLIYSKTPPDAEGEFIEVYSGVLEKGRQVSRRDVTIVELAQVCRVFDYAVVGGRRYFCEPYGWQYTPTIRKRCLEAGGNPLAAVGSLRCQLGVMGQKVNPFERGPKQVSPR